MFLLGIVLFEGGVFFEMMEKGGWEVDCCCCCLHFCGLIDYPVD